MSEPTEPQPDAQAPRARSLTVPVLWFMLGLVVFGAVAVGVFLLIGFLPIGALAAPIQLAAVALLVATAAPAVIAMRRGKVALGSGLLVGYALATVFSSGQCTLWSANPDYDMLTGFFAYILALGGALVVMLITAVADAVRHYQSRRGPTG